MVVKQLLELLGIKNKNDGSKTGGPRSNVKGTITCLQKPKVAEPSAKVEDEISSALASSHISHPEISESANSIVEVENSTIRKDRFFMQFDVVQDFSDHHYAKHVPGKPTKEWTKRIQQEWKLLETDLPGSIYVRVYEERIDLLRAAIVGPRGTPYHDGLFFFDVRFPAEYPSTPPKVHYHSGGLRINPNLYACGKVCLSLLNTWAGSGCEKWIKSSSNMMQVLVSIQGLVLNEKPFFNEPKESKLVNTSRGERNSLAYNEKVFVSSCKTMLYSIWRPPKHFEDLVGHHFYQRRSAIMEACRAYMGGVPVGADTSNFRQGIQQAWTHPEFLSSLSVVLDQLARELDGITGRFPQVIEKDDNLAAGAPTVVASAYLPLAL